MSVPRRDAGSLARAGLLALIVPLLLAAADPSGDVGRCPGMRDVGGDTAPDLVEATGEIVELGTSVRFTLRFADPLVVPDDEGTPFRIDLVLFDPDVPPVDAGVYRGVNRLLRYDAVAEPITTILLLPEAGQSRFIAPTIEDRMLVLQVPGRTLSADEDETGTSPGLDRLRWSVIVRDERACDLLGTGRPTQRLRQLDGPGVQQGTLEEDTQASLGRASWLIATVAAGALVTLAAGAYLLRRRAKGPR